VDQYEKKQLCVLVKAQPQPSQKYQETVCVAAVTLDSRLLRLFPIRFRQLEPARRFTRFDWLEVDVARAKEDPRPESYRVKEDSITIRRHARQSTPEENARLWKPAVSESLTALLAKQEQFGTSLGIIRPEPASIRFSYESITKANAEDQEVSRLVYEQASLLEAPLKKLPPPEYVFRYEFVSGDKEHRMRLHDWEVQTTYHDYKRDYGSPAAALEKMQDFYGTRAPAMNLHLIMGTMKKRQSQFIVIGVLRTTADLDQVDAQGKLI
jgi:hypothetical protein